jgi:hypothetical protein
LEGERRIFRNGVKSGARVVEKVEIFRGGKRGRRSKYF